MMRRKSGRRGFRRYMRSPVAVVASILLFVALVVAFAAPLLTWHPPNEIDTLRRLSAPSRAHPFGTDGLGRDAFSRVMFGTRLSLSVGAGAVTLALLIGTALGTMAGYFRRLDTLIMQVLDGLMAFPAVILAIGIMAFLGSSVSNIIITLGIVYTPRVARVVRSVVLSVRQLPYVEAARSLGANDARVLLGHVVPNSISSVLVVSTFYFAQAILTEASLSFLGVGVPPEVPSWGNMLADGRRFLNQAPWLSLYPGVAIALTVFAFNVAGDRLRDVLDPTLLRD